METTMVRAKFKVTEVKHMMSNSPGFSIATIVMIPVWGNGKDNADWSKATPSGKLEMVVTNPEAVAQFELGADYIMTFEKV